MASPAPRLRMPASSRVLPAGPCFTRCMSVRPGALSWMVVHLCSRVNETVCRILCGNNVPCGESVCARLLSSGLCGALTGTPGCRGVALKCTVAYATAVAGTGRASCCMSCVDGLESRPRQDNQCRLFRQRLRFVHPSVFVNDQSRVMVDLALLTS